MVQLFQLTGKWSVWQTSMVTAGPITCFSTLPATKRQSGICLERPLLAAPSARVFLAVGILSQWAISTRTVSPIMCCILPLLGKQRFGTSITTFLSTVTLDQLFPLTGEL